MLGERLDQRGLWEADRLYINPVGRESFYSLLASMRGKLFRDEDFAELYCGDNRRESVPPSLMATALLLQAYDKASDAEAKERADFNRKLADWLLAYNTLLPRPSFSGTIPPPTTIPVPKVVDLYRGLTHVLLNV